MLVLAIGDFLIPQNKLEIPLKFKKLLVPGKEMNVFARFELNMKGISLPDFAILCLISLVFVFQCSLPEFRVLNDRYGVFVMGPFVIDGALP